MSKYRRRWRTKSAPKWLNNPARAGSIGEEGDVEGEISADEAALQHRDDWSHRPRQDDVDGGDHQGVGGEWRGGGCCVCPHIQKARGGGAGGPDLARPPPDSDTPPPPSACRSSPHPATSQN